MDKIDGKCWEQLCRNPNAIDLIENNKEVIFIHYWKDLFKNPNAIELIKECIQYILKHEEDVQLQVYIYELCENPSTIDIVENYMEYFDNYYLKKLSKNPNAIHIIKSKINSFSYWKNLCNICNKNIIKLIEDNIDKLDSKSREILVSKTDTINIVKENKDLFDYPKLYMNPNIIVIDKEKEEELLDIIYNLIYDKINTIPHTLISEFKIDINEINHNNFIIPKSKSYNDLQRNKGSTFTKVSTYKIFI